MIDVAAISHRVNMIFPLCSIGIGVVVVSLKGPDRAIAHADEKCISRHQQKEGRAVLMNANKPRIGGATISLLLPVRIHSRCICLVYIYHQIDGARRRGTPTVMLSPIKTVACIHASLNLYAVRLNRGICVESPSCSGMGSTSGQ